jgi:polysaccharide biosynthesis protein PslJ
VTAPPPGSATTLAPARRAAVPRAVRPSLPPVQSHPGPVTTRRRDDWPHTSRILPWLIAAFIAMLWLVPFNTISLTVSLPFDLYLDRLVLPLIVVAWALSLVIGGRNAPRVRVTPIHIAVGAYVVVSFLSVIFNVGWLNRELLFNTSLKQLVLLSSYVMFFVIVASVVRPTEVGAFVKLSLGLAVLCGLGTLWEYHFHFDVFYQWAHDLLPSGVFKVPLPDPTAVDELGRPEIYGSAQDPLELVTMLAIALPVALVGAIQSKARRERILYAVAATVLLAANFATYKKSALVVPAVLIVLIAAFRPRLMVRLLPIVLVVFVAVHLLAPAALSGVLDQLIGGHVTAVGTTAHRTSAYRDVRPLVWARPLFGQGYGSYNAHLLRIFDSQWLTSLIDTGVIGVVALLSMMLTVLAVARPLFSGHDRNSERARLALGLGVGAIGLLASSFLYDAMSFPHGPYIFLSFAAFVAVLAGASDAPSWRNRRRSAPVAG